MRKPCARGLYSYQPGDPTYFGLNAEQWVGTEREMMQDLAGRVSNLDYINPRANFIRDIVDRTAEDFGISRQEAQNNLFAAHRDGPNAESFAVQMGFPSAHADEKLGLGALELSGYDDVKMLNAAGLPQATDLQGQFGGRTFNIDSQKSLNPGPLLQLGALQNIETDRGVRQLLREMPQDTSVLEALQKLQEYSRATSGGQLLSYDNEGRLINVSGNEDKLMQSSTSRFNPNPSQSYQSNEELLRKDGLLWSERGGYQPQFQEFYGRGPYDSEKPRGLFLADMESLRQELADTPLNEFQGQIIAKPVDRKRKRLKGSARDRGNQLSDVKLALPKTSVRGSRGGRLPRLAGEAIQALTTR